MNISSYKTNKTSKNYPHTRAILVREAKYQYVPIGRGERHHAHGGDERAQRNDTQQQPATPNNAQQGQTGQQAPINQPEPAQPAQPKQEQQNQPEPAQPKQEQQQQQAPAGISQAAQQVIDLTNEQRKQNGLPALQADTQLSGVAQMKSEDMRQNGYFSHTSPTHGSPFDMMRDQGVSYKTAGENIAQGQPTPQEVVKAWMDSPGHRKNILSSDFTHIGVGYDSSGHHWTQMFIGK
ncbi:CAP domain-containing protein [Mesobacillus maritimus]